MISLRGLDLGWSKASGYAWVGNWGLRVLSGIVCGLVNTEHLSGRWTGDGSSWEACGSVVEWLYGFEQSEQ